MKIFKSISKEEYNVKSFKDRRKRVNRLIARYFMDGDEYRKYFEFSVATNYHDMLVQVSRQIN